MNILVKTNKCRLIAIVEMIIILSIVSVFVHMFIEPFDFMAIGTLIVYSPHLIILIYATHLNWKQKIKQNKISLIIDILLLAILLLTFFRYLNVWQANDPAFYENAGLSKTPVVTTLDNFLTFSPYFALPKFLLGLLTIALCGSLIYALRDKFILPAIK